MGSGIKRGSPGKVRNALLADRITPYASLNHVTNVQCFFMSPHCLGRIPPGSLPRSSHILGDDQTLADRETCDVAEGLLGVIGLISTMTDSIVIREVDCANNMVELRRNV
jgi:hypothetical protein